jgi:hypothetical protein
MQSELFTNTAQRPSPTNLLAHVNSLVNIQIGGDEGYLDYTLIQTKSSIDINEFENKMFTCASQYNTLLKESIPPDESWKNEFYIERFNEIFND